MEILTDIKRKIRIILRRFKDYKEHTVFCKKREISELRYSHRLIQPILSSATFFEKNYNLNYAAELFKQHIIRPGEVFSFWNIIGNPNKLKGSRCIRNNKVRIEKGGGLCQAAGIIYHLSVLCGLKILERHNHSIDLYGDGPRACPIGLDATVSYGYKDLRIYNNTNATLRFYLSVANDELQAELQSSTPLNIRKIAIEKKESNNIIEVKTFDAETGELVANNIYKTIE